MSDENYDGAIYHVQEVDDTFEGAIYHVKVVEGGGDKHNLGYYATQAALEEAHPTAEAGDWAIVGSTDTVWVWDEDSTAWVDTDTKGEVTPDMIIVKSATMPTASTTPAGAVYQYTGESDASYTHGYIYENVATTTSSSATAAQTVGSSLSDIAVDLETLESFTGWTTDNYLQIFYTGDGWSVDTTSLGVTYTGTPSVGDAITITYTAAVTTYAWTRVDVQPAPEALPSQTGYSGRVLGTDGFVAGWVVPEQVQRSVMPQASSDELGNIYQFKGTTDANYTNGYFYKCVATAAEATASQTYGSGLTDISVTNISTFASAFETGFSTSIFDTTVEFEYDGAGWMVSTEIEGQTESLFDQDITDWAVTFTGTAQEGDTISVVYTGATYAWTRVDVQPSPNIIDDNSTAVDKTWSANKLNTTIGNIETLLSQI